MDRLRTIEIMGRTWRYYLNVVVAPDPSRLFSAEFPIGGTSGSVRFVDTEDRDIEVVSLPPDRERDPSDEDLRRMFNDALRRTFRDSLGHLWGVEWLPGLEGEKAEFTRIEGNNAAGRVQAGAEELTTLGDLSWEELDAWLQRALKAEAS